MNKMFQLVVLGGGESGVGAAMLAKHKGLTVFLSDGGSLKPDYREQLTKAQIPFEEGGHSEGIVLEAKEIVKSPGIPDKAPIVQAAKGKKIPVISEIEFGARYSQAKHIAITGSNGKTTTTLLTHHLVKEAGIDAALAGNVGYSLAGLLVEKDHKWFVLEVSSFQLDGCFKFKANVGVILNITHDHMDRYDYVFQNYVDSKFRMAQNMTPSDFLVVYLDGGPIEAELEKRDILAKIIKISLDGPVEFGAWYEDEFLYFRLPLKGVAPENQKFGIPVGDLPLKGKHNQMNVMAAVVCAILAGASVDAIRKALPQFNNAPHRLEEVATINGAKYINDSKATNVDSVKFALDSFSEPLVWIAGGVDKGNDYNQIEAKVMKSVKVLIALGTDNKPLIEYFSAKVPAIYTATSMEEAIKKAHQVANNGDVVLLSPACASFDLFKNYEDRGNQFRTKVLELKG